MLSASQRTPFPTACPSLILQRPFAAGLCAPHAAGCRSAEPSQRDCRGSDTPASTCQARSRRPSKLAGRRHKLGRRPVTVGTAFALFTDTPRRTGGLADMAGALL